MQGLFLRPVWREGSACGKPRMQGLLPLHSNSSVWHTPVLVQVLQ